MDRGPASERRPAFFVRKGRVAGMSFGKDGQCRLKQAVFDRDVHALRA